MNRLKWWFRVVGVIYVLLGVGFIPFINAARLGVMLPGFDAPIRGVAYRGLLDFSFMFGLDLLVIGAFLLFSSRNPLRYIPLVWLIVALEIVRGIFDDIYMIARGYFAPFYIGFILLHLVIIVTGVVFTRRAKAEAR
ncbi:MAG: BphX family protein [Chloroflexi bacterium]|nr:BphX family protein [Chloroflexota bacterium]